MLVSKKSCTRPPYHTRSMLENGRGGTLERTIRLEEPSPLVKARLEKDDTCMRPSQCHCKKKAKPKKDLWSPLLSKPCQYNDEKNCQLLMFKWVTLEIWRKLFLAPRNFYAQVGRNLWPVQNNYASLFALTLFFWSDFLEKKFLKLKLKVFSGF